VPLAVECYRRLTAAGIDLSSAECTGQFELRVNTDAYLHNGQYNLAKFGGDAVIDFMRTQRRPRAMRR